MGINSSLCSHREMYSSKIEIVWLNSASWVFWFFFWLLGFLCTVSIKRAVLQVRENTCYGCFSYSISFSFFFLPSVVVKQFIDKTNSKMKHRPIHSLRKDLLTFCSRQAGTDLNHSVQGGFAFWSLLSLQEEGCAHRLLSPVLPAFLLHMQVRKGLPENLNTKYTSACHLYRKNVSYCCSEWKNVVLLDFRLPGSV